MEGRIKALESTPPTPPHNCATREELDITNDKVKRLVGAIDEGIARVDRSEKRINATLARARKELKKRGYEDPGLEAEAAEFRDVNGAGSEEQRLPAVRAALAEAEEQASSIPGVPLATLQRARGIV